MQPERAAKVSAIPIGAPDQSSRPNMIRYRIPIASIMGGIINPRPLCGLVPMCQKLVITDRACPRALFFAGLLYDLVGAQQDHRRDRQAERLGGPQIEHNFELGGALGGQVQRLRTFSNPRNVAGNLPIGVAKACSVTGKRKMPVQ